MLGSKKKKKETEANYATTPDKDGEKTKAEYCQGL